MKKSQQYSLTRLLIMMSGAGLIFVPLVTVYGAKLMGLATLFVLFGVVGLAWFYAKQVVGLPTKAGVAFSALGAVLWEMGWGVMILVDKQFGWGVFIVGWALLTAGLMLQGFYMIKKGPLPDWNKYLCLVGALPLIAELSNPFFFTSLLPLVQVVMMIFYGVGWVFIGKSLTVHPEVEEVQKFVPVGTPVQTPPLPHAIGTD